MLFAAGFGTRMKHLTAHQPKPLVQVGGKALIDHSIDLARAITPKNIVANLHYLPQMLVDHLSGTEVQTVTEAPDVLETGGGLRNALPLLGTDPVFTMNTDAIWKGPILCNRRWTFGTRLKWMLCWYVSLSRKLLVILVMAISQLHPMAVWRVGQVLFMAASRSLKLTCSKRSKKHRSH